MSDPTNATNQGLRSSSDPKGKKDYSTASTLLTTPKVLSRTQRGPIHSPAVWYSPSEPPLEPAEQSPPHSRVADLPSGERTNSASLEATPRLTELTIHRLTCPSGKGIKCQPLRRRAQVERRQAAMPHSGCDRGPVRQLRSLLRHPQPCADIPGTAPATVLPTPHTPFVLSLLQNPRSAWAQPSDAARALTRARSPPG